MTPGGGEEGRPHPPLQRRSTHQPALAWGLGYPSAPQRGSAASGLRGLWKDPAATWLKPGTMLGGRRLRLEGCSEEGCRPAAPTAPEGRLPCSVHEAVSPQHSACPSLTSPGGRLGRFLRERCFPRAEVRSFWETPCRTFKELSRWQLNNRVHSVPRSDYKYSKLSERAANTLPRQSWSILLARTGARSLVPTPRGTLAEG